MGFTVSCPRCGQSVSSKSRNCEHCGVNLAVAAVLVEQAMMKPESILIGLPIVPEILVPRIGDYLIERDILSQEDLNRALDYQKEKAAAGKPTLLGQALLELGLIDREALDQIITIQILELHNALNEANKSLEKRVEERTKELQRALSRLSELNALKSNFIANISHELRTPLTHIKAYVDLLAEAELGPLTNEQAEALAVLTRSETRLEKLIEDLIQFSFASRGELSLNIQDVDILQLVRNCASRYITKAQSKKTIIKTFESVDSPLIQADEDKIGWVIMQLLDNAIKFTPEGGKIAIKVSNASGLVVISVIDTGIGVPEDRKVEIFEPFHQLDGSATRRYSGTGLGLAMARRIIEAHGSQIIVDSQVGKGSKFEFTLPSANIHTN